MVQGMLPVPDGVDRCHRSRNAPLMTLGRPDAIRLLPACNASPERPTSLTGAVLCFPAHWTLSEKDWSAAPGHSYPGRPHTTTTSAGGFKDCSTRLRPGQLLTRANAHLHKDPRSVFCPGARVSPRRIIQGRKQGISDRNVRHFANCPTQMPSSSRSIHFWSHLKILTDEQRQSLDSAGVRIS